MTMLVTQKGTSASTMISVGYLQTMQRRTIAKSTCFYSEDAVSTQVPTKVSNQKGRKKIEVRLLLN